MLHSWYRSLSCYSLIARHIPVSPGKTLNWKKILLPWSLFDNLEYNCASRHWWCHVVVTGICGWAKNPLVVVVLSTLWWDYVLCGSHILLHFYWILYVEDCRWTPTNLHPSHLIFTRSSVDDCALCCSVSRWLYRLAATVDVLQKVVCLFFFLMRSEKEFLCSSAAAVFSPVWFIVDFLVSKNPHQKSLEEKD